MIRAPEYTKKRNFLELFSIKSLSLSLKEQLDTGLLVLPEMM